MSQPTLTDRLKGFLPHLGAVLLFIVLTYAYMLPMLQGLVLEQHDHVSAKGQQHEAVEYYEETGENALWTQSMFSGMPTVMIWLNYKSNLVGEVSSVVIEGLQENANLLFLLLLGSYIMGYGITNNFWLALIAAIGFAFGSFNLVSIEAGHYNKVICMALIAPVVGGIIMSYRGKWFLGSLIAGFAFAAMVRMGHVQIAYYTVCTGMLLGLFYLGVAVKNKTLPDFGRSTAVLLVFLMLGVGSNTAQLWLSKDYGDATIRGGKSELSINQGDNSGGLTKDYAFNWSYGIGETMTMLIPNFKGGGSSDSYKGTDTYEKIHPLLVKSMQQRGYKKAEANKAADQTIGSLFYWGEQPFTSGPVYFGAIICFLFVLGLMIIDTPVKWVLLAISVITIMLSWGKNFPLFNYAVFDIFPMYNKLRTVTMVLTITNLMFVIMAFLALKQVYEKGVEQAELMKGIKIALGVTIGLVVVFGFLGGSMYDYEGLRDASFAQSGFDISMIQADRKSLLYKDSFRSIVFVLLGAGAIWAFVTDKLKAKYFLAVVAVLILVDLWSVDKRYLNDNDFVSKKQFENNFDPRPSDIAVLQDKDPHYRILDLTQNPFTNSGPSYLHKNIGGYHAVKIRIYQELIEGQMSKDLQTLQSGLQGGALPKDIPTLNMLNMKYLIFGDAAQQVVQNQNALGNAWLISNVEYVSSADEEMAKLDQFDPATTALVRDTYKDRLGGFQAKQPKGSVKLASYSPNKLTYEFDSPEQELVMFSEVFYKDGTEWHATIDGEPAEHFRANYVLKGMLVPAGKHQIEFEFEPRLYGTVNMVSMVSSILMFLGFGLLVFLKVKKGDAFNG